MYFSFFSIRKYLNFLYFSIKTYAGGTLEGPLWAGSKHENLTISKNENLKY